MLVIHIHSDYTHAQCLVIGIQTEHYLNKMNIDVCSTSPFLSLRLWESINKYMCINKWVQCHFHLKRNQLILNSNWITGKANYTVGMSYITKHIMSYTFSVVFCCCFFSFTVPLAKCLLHILRIWPASSSRTGDVCIVCRPIGELDRVLAHVLCGVECLFFHVSMCVLFRTGGWGKDLTTKRHEETFSCDKNILHLDFGGGYLTEHLSKFLELYVYLKRRNYTSINLALEIRHHINHKQNRTSTL